MKLYNTLYLLRITPPRHRQFLTRMSTSLLSPPHTNVRIVLITAPLEEAKALAQGLVENNLVACAQVNEKITSFYRWEGKVLYLLRFPLAVVHTSGLCM